MNYKIIFLGDVCGEAGRKAVAKGIEILKDKYQPDFVIINGENSAGGFGITPKIAEEFFSLGVDCITLGDHTFDRKEIIPYLEKEKKIIRPLNYPSGAPGKGIYITRKKNILFIVINLIGRVFMKPVDCPFRRIEEALAKINEKGIIIVDFHAEATAEKKAMGYFLDGKVSAVLGTHTHIPTADAKILPKGTAYISDVGMCGATNSILGMRIEDSLKRFLYGINYRLTPADSASQIEGVLIEIDAPTYKAVRIERIWEENLNFDSMSF
ncbi:MAG: TIGR00282 family metallophosphoesterase [candidate division WOR-3 bacterium]|nr:TIGR00282 family metallophosphoesterase [candidate division WOR-3 bacterium]